jgi:hypothetical protein
VDDRTAEVTSALIFSAVAAGCVFADIAHMEGVTPFTNLLLVSMVSVAAVDNFYDLLKAGTALAAKQVSKDSDDSFNLPEKDSLPLGLGSGQLTGNVLKGLARLFTIDAERESQCEAAALFAAYSLGLPCFSFRPNALEGSVLVIDSTDPGNPVNSLDSSSGLLRMLIWLLAPVAMESSKHSQLIMSDPREASNFMDRLEGYATKSGIDLECLYWSGDEQERQDLLKWAYTEADLLLRENRGTVSEIARCLTGGAATIGDCIAVIEKW